jgi:hypothetical protein
MAAVAGPQDSKILGVRDTTLRANCLFYNAHKPNDILSIRQPFTKRAEFIRAMATVYVPYGTETVER